MSLETTTLQHQNEKMNVLEKSQCLRCLATVAADQWYCPTCKEAALIERRAASEILQKEGI